VLAPNEHRRVPKSTSDKIEEFKRLCSSRSLKNRRAISSMLSSRLATAGWRAAAAGVATRALVERKMRGHILVLIASLILIADPVRSSQLRE
jgi:hypothetical protein